MSASPRYKIQTSKCRRTVTDLVQNSYIPGKYKIPRIEIQRLGACIEGDADGRATETNEEVRFDFAKIGVGDGPEYCRGGVAVQAGDGEDEGLVSGGSGRRSE